MVNIAKTSVLLLGTFSAVAIASGEPPALLRPQGRLQQEDSTQESHPGIEFPESLARSNYGDSQPRSAYESVSVGDDESIRPLYTNANADTHGVQRPTHDDSASKSLTQEDVSLIFELASGNASIDSNLQGSGIGDKAITATSLVMEHFVAAFENYRRHLSGISKLFPWAGVIEFLVSVNAVCPIVDFVETIVAVNLPSVRIQTTQEYPQNPDGTLPRPWKDLKGCDAWFVDEDTIRAEKASYYYVYRMYDTFYAYATDTAEDKELLDPLAPGWGPQTVHFRNATSVGGQWRESPFSVVTEKDGHVLVAMRGTMYQDEYRASSIYEFTEPNETVPYFEGKVHSGAFQLFKEMLPPLLQDIKSRSPNKVTLIGHSVGGVIATMLGAYLGRLDAKEWGVKEEGAERGKGMEVEVLTVGAYAPGDREFWEKAKGGMNVRNIRYLGEGWIEDGLDAPGKMYTMGDVVAQAPGVPLPTCMHSSSGNETLWGVHKDAGWFDYYMPPCTVAIYPTSIKNTAAWRDKTNMLDPARMAVVLSHKCPYTCWLTDGMGDPNTRCYFQEQREVQQQGIRAWIGSLWKKGGKGGKGMALRDGEICRRTEADLYADLDLTRDPRIRGSIGQG